MQLGVVVEVLVLRDELQHVVVERVEELELELGQEQLVERVVLDKIVLVHCRFVVVVVEVLDKFVVVVEELDRFVVVVGVVVEGLEHILVVVGELGRFVVVELDKFVVVVGEHDSFELELGKFVVDDKLVVVEELGMFALELDKIELELDMTELELDMIVVDDKKLGVEHNPLIVVGKRVVGMKLENKKQFVGGKLVVVHIHSFVVDHILVSLEGSLDHILELHKLVDHILVDHMLVVHILVDRKLVGHMQLVVHNLVHIHPWLVERHKLRQQ